MEEDEIVPTLVSIGLKVFCTLPVGFAFQQRHRQRKLSCTRRRIQFGYSSPRSGFFPRGAVFCRLTSLLYSLSDRKKVVHVNACINAPSIIFAGHHEDGDEIQPGIGPSDGGLHQLHREDFQGRYISTV